MKFVAYGSDRGARHRRELAVDLEIAAADLAGQHLKKDPAQQLAVCRRKLIGLAKFKSNRDYERELQRRAHAFPAVTSTFAENVSIFDRVWYGLHEVNPELVAHFAGNVERIRVV